ncbi:CpaF family protein [Desulfurispora thermophila]|uniref:CpaF family protein n=1 Tax=Desulfurispora thermophila TaxID=265470 RepID=UPI0003792B92|nr:ATPase, T2SS/T4P/T4SS family [Desulfurispora thermophila]
MEFGADFFQGEVNLNHLLSKDDHLPNRRVVRLSDVRSSGSDYESGEASEAGAASNDWQNSGGTAGCEELKTHCPDMQDCHELMQSLCSSFDLGSYIYGKETPGQKKVVGLVNEETVNSVRKYLLDHHSQLFSRSVLDPSVRPVVKEKIDEFVRINEIRSASLSLEDLVEKLVQEICGLGVLDPLLQDDSITDILVYGPEEVYIIRHGRTEKADCKFRDNDHIMTVIRKVLNAASESATKAKPVVDARLPDCRVNVVIEPIARGGNTIIIRKFPPTNLNEEKLVSSGQMSEEMLRFFKVVMAGSVNGVVCGPTGSGKTTLLKELVRYMPDKDRIMTIEDTEEMRLKKLYPHKIIDSLECRSTGKTETTVDMEVLLKAALRRTPQRIIPGEVRGPEAMVMLEILNTGHFGFTTLHAKNARDAISRILLMITRGSSKLNEDAIGKLIASTIDIVIFQRRLRDGKFRILEVAEVRDYVNKTPVINMLYKFRVTRATRDEIEGVHERCGNISQELAERLNLDGIPWEEIKEFTGEN